MRVTRHHHAFFEFFEKMLIIADYAATPFTLMLLDIDAISCCALLLLTSLSAILFYADRRRCRFTAADIDMLNTRHESLPPFLSIL